jgi:fructose-1,6-bisphosphatase/inositol monophosphatase family enzyme
MANLGLLSDALPAKRGGARRPGRALGRARKWHLWLAALLTLALLPPAGSAAATPALAAPGRLDTTVADFAAWPVPAGLTVADEAGGELRRAAALEDYFDGPLSSGLWSWGS